MISKPKANLILVEILRWAIITTPLYLSAWRWAEIGGYPSYVNTTMTNLGESSTFLVVTGLGLLLVSVAVYLPLKILVIRYRMRNKLFSDNRWRPSIVTYIFLAAMPSMTMIIVAIETGPGQARNSIDGGTITVLQIVVLGLVATEWIAKIREEFLSYDLVTAMALDFFFAYDIIAFIMMVTYDPQLYHSSWVYIGFSFTFIAMFKYTPNCPSDVDKRGTAKGTVIYILVSIILNDIPFVIVRVTTMIIYGALISDIIYPLKNIAMIIFGIMQIVIIQINLNSYASTGEVAIPIHRVTKFPGAWSGGDVTPSGSIVSVIPLPEGASKETSSEDKQTKEATTEKQEKSE